MVASRVHGVWLSSRWRRWSCCWRFASRLRQVLRRSCQSSLSRLRPPSQSDSRCALVIAPGFRCLPCRSFWQLSSMGRWLPSASASQASFRALGRLTHAGQPGRPRDPSLLDWLALVALAFEASPNETFGWLFLTAATVMAVEQFTDLLLGSVVARLRGIPVSEMARNVSTMFLAMPLYVPVTALLVFACSRVSTWSVVLFLFPAFVAQKLFVLYQEQRATAQELSAAMLRQEKAHLSFASALVATLDARDEYTAGHSAAVAIYARDVAERLGLSQAEQRIAHLCGLVHDIGKIGLAAGLLEKAGPLTLDERRQMEQHSVIGERILAKVEDYSEIARVVRHHHERVDGRGYPDGLRGDEIPLLSRIIAAADAYNAMTSHRPYRDAMPSRVARLRMAQAVGSQFDTTVVAAFEAILASAAEPYRVASRVDFAFGSQEREYVGPLAVATGLTTPVGAARPELQEGSTFTCRLECGLSSTSELQAFAIRDARAPWLSPR